MPTGYTHRLYEGEQSFGEFVHECAKSCFIAFRDAGPGADFEKTVEQGMRDSLRYREQRLEDAQKEFDEAQTLTVDAALAKLNKGYQKDLSDWEARLPVLAARRERFERMISRVKQMQVPENDQFLTSLKKFMLEQLGLESFGPPAKPTPPTREDAEDYVVTEKKWAISRLERERRDLEATRDALEKQKNSLKLLKKLLKETP